MKRLTLQDIAQSVDAPVDQVTKVLLGQPGVSDELRHRILAAMDEAGLTRIARGTSNGTIGVVIPGTTDGDYIAEVVRGISDTAANRGYSIVLYGERNSKEHELIQMLGPGGCDGIIAVVPNNYQRLLELCHAHHRSYVLVDYQGDDELDEALTVEVHNRQSITDVMDYLYDLGHRRIAFMTGMMKHASARQRLQGYLDALAAHSISYDPALMLEGDWFHPLAYELSQPLLALDERPTAIVASNDLMAFGAMQAARQLGLEIGVDVSITGFDDIDMASTVTPALTTVRQPMLQIGEIAAEMLLKAITDQPIAERHVLLDTELIIRQSTGPMRK
jgi:LacI family transcriptional regulator